MDSFFINNETCMEWCCLIPVYVQASRIHSVFTQPFLKDTRRVQQTTQGSRRTHWLPFCSSYISH